MYMVVSTIWLCFASIQKRSIALGVHYLLPLVLYYSLPDLHYKIACMLKAYNRTVQNLSTTGSCSRRDRAQQFVESKWTISAAKLEQMSKVLKLLVERSKSF